MWRETATFKGAKIVKVCMPLAPVSTSRANRDQVGTIDDAKALADAKPAIELFAPQRVPWVQAVPDTEQKDAM